ncbi:MAG: histidinol-phosphate transaminase [Gammaproteobacteria bacterium]
MTNTTRRSFLIGAAGLSVIAGACTTGVSPAQVQKNGAFPKMPGGAELIGPQPGVARLLNNENPYGPSQSARDGIEYAARKSAYYADGVTKKLAAMIAQRHGLTPEHVTISTGSAEALSAIAVLLGREGPIVAPRLFFDATPLYAQNLGLATIERAPMATDMSVDIAALESRVNDDTGLVQLCNPNNPTGLLSDADTLKAAVKRMAAKAPVVVDEAYMELTSDPEKNSCIDLIAQGHEVIVSRTFSKLYGMAGARVGYVMSSPDMARRIRSANMTWMSGLGLAGAIGCYGDTAFTDQSRARILEGREMVTTAAQQLDMVVLPSQTNFVYFKSGMPANTLQAAMAQRNILIRGQYMDYADWSRVSMGHLDDVARFCRALPEVVGA